MANISANDSGIFQCACLFNAETRPPESRRRERRRRWMFLAAVIFLSPIVFAQATPQVTGLDPTSGKVNDKLTVSGTNLDKPGVSAVYLSDDKNDFKATIVEQSSDKIVITVPEVKPGDYNVSLQEGDKLFIKPIKFTVQE
jgi:IPT/TIG domain